MRFHTAINKFCYEASLNKPLTVWKENYNQYRPYLGLNDAISSILFFLENSDHWNQTYNVLTGNYMLKDIVENIGSLVDIKVKMVNTPLLNQYSYHVSDKKLKNLCCPSKDNLELEIINTIKQFKDLNHG